MASTSMKISLEPNNEDIWPTGSGFEPGDLYKFTKKQNESFKLCDGPYWTIPLSNEVMLCTGVQNTGMAEFYGLCWVADKTGAANKRMACFKLVNMTDIHASYMVKVDKPEHLK